jgi:hypothetical protein
MKAILSIALLVCCTSVYAAASEQGCASSGGTAAGCSSTNNGGAGGNGGNGGAGGSSNSGGNILSSTLNSQNHNSNTNVNGNSNTNKNSNSNKQGQEQGQLQGQAQGQAQGQVAKGGNAKQGQGQAQDASNNGVTTTVAIDNPVAAASAASFVAAVGSLCGGSAGVSGQGIGGGGLFGFAFEFTDCKVLRESAMLASFGKMDSAIQHLCKIDRIADTFAESGEFTCKSSKKVSANSKAGRS